ncbi:MAG: hypothetical protein M3P29_04670, partial [Acidobacteriota bacterium]|nr:hypothetical protein [Acidobacteriota bacterium]
MQLFDAKEVGAGGALLLTPLLEYVARVFGSRRCLRHAGGRDCGGIVGGGEVPPRSFRSVEKLCLLGIERGPSGGQLLAFARAAL